MSVLNKSKIPDAISITALTIFAAFLCYPLLWMFFASFKENREIFTGIVLLPEKFSFDAYRDGWRGVSGNTFTRFFANSFLLVIPTALFTVISSALVAYGFARFEFRGKKILFIILLSTLMLPNSIMLIPRYSIFRDLRVLDSYNPFYMMSAFACYPFFTYMLVQFIRGIPKELDESARIDGCNSFRTLISILLPLLKPALFSAGLFQFLWTYNDYFNPLIYINSIRKFPVSLALRLTLDAETVIPWNIVMAMSSVAVLPVVILFFFCQKYFVEGIATTGIKG
ncbi:MAG: carbohydrate ABC transporter permease [Treponema sp.]|jgi:oligogalacturonide transport system permease protein|nr:carbohydrate ABC transporter permease [Treponema sp.]